MLTCSNWQNGWANSCSVQYKHFLFQKWNQTECQKYCQRQHPCSYWYCHKYPWKKSPGIWEWKSIVGLNIDVMLCVILIETLVFFVGSLLLIFLFLCVLCYYKCVLTFWVPCCDVRYSKGIFHFRIKVLLPYA